MKDFDDKVAAITGAASGIGRALALELARCGCHLAICCDRNVKGLNQTAREARESPEILRRAPVTTPVGRLNEARAARSLDVRW